MRLLQWAALRCDREHCHLLILSCLSSSLVWAQLMLFVPAWGTRSPFPQNGAPIHRVRAHSLTGIRNTTHFVNYVFVFGHWSDSPKTRFRGTFHEEEEEGMLSFLLTES
jgi:hypothetical protein